MSKRNLVAVTVLTLILLGSRAFGKEPAAPKRLTLTAGEEKVVDNCLTIIRGCQLPDGAISMKNDGTKAASPVWISPYFANYAALALLAQCDRKKNPVDLAVVEKWLAWCAKNQTPDGYWNDFVGTFAGYKSNGKVDAWDSSAAMFLLVVDRYQRGGGKVSQAMQEAAKKALKCIDNVTGEDGLTWATPTYKVKFLMDNIEVYSGLVAGSRYFVACGAKTEAKHATDQAETIAKKLPGYWQDEDKLFAYALHANDTFEGGLKKLYPHGLAQLFGIGFVAAKRDAWTALSKKFLPDNGVEAAAGAERWLVAASRLGGNDAKAWRVKVADNARGFTSRNVYVHRPAVAVLGLLEGADWMPNLVPRN